MFQEWMTSKEKVYVYEDEWLCADCAEAIKEDIGDTLLDDPEEFPQQVHKIPLRALCSECRKEL